MNKLKSAKKDVFMAVAYTIILVLFAIPVSFLGMRALNYLLATL